MMNKRPCGILLGMLLLLGVLVIPPVRAGVTTLVCASTSGPVDSMPNSPSLNMDGRYIAFESKETNLVPGDTNKQQDVFVRDCQTGEITRASVASNGTQANSGSGVPIISGDGRYVAFESDASNLVPGDTNKYRDVFVHDCQSGETTRVSVASDGTQTDGSSYCMSISSDGRYVTFASYAHNLTTDDPDTTSCIYIHDRQTGQTIHLKLASDAYIGPGPYNVISCVISRDARRVAYMSKHSDIVPGDTNGMIDIFVYDRGTNETTRVSLATDGTQFNDHCYYPSISWDGRYVAFESDATNLPMPEWYKGGDVFVYDLQTRQLSRASETADGEFSRGNSYWPQLNADGRYAAFCCGSDYLVPGIAHPNVLIRDRTTGQLIRANARDDGTPLEIGGMPAISGDGRALAFTCCDDSQVYLHNPYATSSPIWSESMGAPVVAGPLAYNGCVYAVNETGIVRAYNMTSGASVWSFDCRQNQLPGDASELRVVNRPAIYGAAEGSERLYLTTTNGYVFCLGLDGGLIWRSRPTQGPNGAPAPCAEWIYFAYQNQVARVDAATGNTYQTSAQADGAITTGLSIPRQDLIWFGTDRGTLYCMNADLSAFRTSISLNSDPLTLCPAVFWVNAIDPSDPYNLWVKDFRLYLGTNDRKLHVLNPMTFGNHEIVSLGMAGNSSVWCYRDDFDIDSITRLLMSGSDGTLQCRYSQGNGMYSTWKCDGGFKGSPVSVGRYLLQAGDDGVLHTFHRYDIRPHCDLIAAGSLSEIGVAMLDSMPYAFVGSSNGNLYAFRIQ